MKVYIICAIFTLGVILAHPDYKDQNTYQLFGATILWPGTIGNIITSEYYNGE